MSDASEEPRQFRRIAALVALIPFAFLAWRFWFVCDDAYISFRYARHLADGDGLVYNLGRETPVEGYSNFLWVVWLAIFELFGRLAPIAAPWTSALLAAVLIFRVVRFTALRMGLGLAGQLATGLFLATLPPTAMWATSGLAAMPLALFVFLVYESLFEDPDHPRAMRAGIFGLLAGLIRADGLFWVGLILACAYALRIVQKRPELGRAAIRAGVLIAIGTLIYVGWRYSYYGDYLPNTARIKAGFSGHRIDRGIDYAITLLLIVPSMTLVLLLSLSRWRSDLTDIVVPALVLALAGLAYSIWVGGDFMPFGRFVFASVPFIALLFAALFSAAGGWTVRAGLATTLCLPLSVLACYDVNVVPRSTLERFHFRLGLAHQTEVERWADMDKNVQLWAVWGRALAMHTQPGESSIEGGIGVLGYNAYELFLYDRYGLVSPEVIGHARVSATSTPGHDMKVSNQFFLPYKPTFFGTLLAPKNSAPFAGPLAALGDKIRALLVVEDYPIAPADGDASVLRVLRMKN
jgi:arabinofuranosyltransferase